MTTATMLLMTLLLVAAAAYTHAQIGRFTAKRRNVLLTRGVLIAVGIASGTVSASLYAADGFTAALAFLSGFGAVHVPAAFILLIKRGRGAGRT